MRTWWPRPGWAGAPSDALHREGDVVPAETERVVEGRDVAVRQLPVLVAHDVELDLAVEVVDVDRGRRQAVVDREDREDSLQRPGRPEEVAGHRLRGADRH